MSYQFKSGNEKDGGKKYEGGGGLEKKKRKSIIMITMHTFSVASSPQPE